MLLFAIFKFPHKSRDNCPAPGCNVNLVASIFQNIFEQLNWKSFTKFKVLINLTPPWITFTVIKDGSEVRLQWKPIWNYNPDAGVNRTSVSKIHEKNVHLTVNKIYIVKRKLNLQTPKYVINKITNNNMPKI